MAGNRLFAPSRVAAGIACWLAACAPAVETPTEAAHRRDQRDAAALALMLQRLPAVTEAHVTLSRPAVEPLRGEREAAPGSAAVLLVVASPPPAELVADARALVAAGAPQVAPERITVIARSPHAAPKLAALGPFAVAPSSRAPLLAALVGLLLVCAALAATLVWRERARRLDAPR